MKVAVTGGAGYIGSHTVAQLAGAGHEVVVLDDMSRGHPEAIRRHRCVRVELGAEDAVRGILQDERVDAVMHFAASAYVGESVEQPEKYYFNNVVNTLRLLRAMRAVGIHRFVFSGSCAVYGIPDRVPITEDMPMRPISPYGHTKAVVETILENYSRAYGFRYASLRYFNAAGAMPDGSFGEDHDPETHLIPLVIQAALGVRESVVIHGADYPTPDGTCIRDYVHVLDLGRAHVLALEAMDGRPTMVYNLGTGRGHSVREVIRAVEEASGRRVPVREGPRREGDPPELTASPGRVVQELGWKPEFPALRQIVETAWRWHSGHPRGFAGGA